jgi:alkanesulfonate monooxygenase SsuD/methylene tetrahydromethanopterin reductase-like flavin-dependent oxidoreductase (luciferase family)
MTAGTFRQPGSLAIIAATVDQMSGGRVELGIGTGWYEREHQSFGIGFPSVRERFGRLEEQLTVITGLWSTPRGERFSFTGKHYQLDECANFPAPAGDLEAGTGPRPRPRIVIGGGGPRRTPDCCRSARRRRRRSSSPTRSACSGCDRAGGAGPVPRARMAG